MAFILAHFEIEDFEMWKRERFDRDPGGRKELAKGYVVSRGVEDPSQVFVRVEFDSAETAATFRERLMQSGALEGINVKIPPTVVEAVDSGEY